VTSQSTGSHRLDCFQGHRSKFSSVGHRLNLVDYFLLLLLLLPAAAVLFCSLDYHFIFLLLLHVQKCSRT